jgi:uncharacterized OB-fold protein
MPLFAHTMPTPEPDGDDHPFWDACRERRLCFQVCRQCGQARHPPTPVCARCLSFDAVWRESAGKGTIYSYTIIHHASHPAVRDHLPYAVALVEFDDTPGVRLVTNITGCPPDQLQIGQAVVLWWDALADGLWLPRFSPAGGSTS